MVTWADCLVALQQRQVDAVSTDDSILAGLVAQDPYLHIVGPSLNEEPYGIGINLQNTGLVRFVNGTLERIRRDGTWNTLYRKWLTVLGPRAGAPGREVFGLMAEARRLRRGAGTPGEPTVGHRRRPSNDLDMDSMSTMRPMATQAVFRPHFDETRTALPPAPPTPNPTSTSRRVTRALSPTRRLGGGLVEIPRVPDASTRSKR